MDNEEILKKIAPYLPYGLQCYGASDVWTIHSMGIENISFFNGIILQECSFDYFFTDYSLLFRPLSDLTKEIEVDGNKITHSFNLFNVKNDIKCVYFINTIKDKTMCFYQAERLLEWHFDIFGLIEKGLAIDINTLKQ